MNDCAVSNNIVLIFDVMRRVCCCFCRTWFLARLVEPGAGRRVSTSRVRLLRSPMRQSPTSSFFSGLLFFSGAYHTAALGTVAGATSGPAGCRPFLACLNSSACDDLKAAA
jgi:hypothetical protein